MSDNILARYGMGPTQNALAPTLKEGPAPTGYDKMFDAIYGWMGGTPDKRNWANALATAADYGTLGMLTGAYDGGRELAETGRPASLAMALMPGAKVAAPVAKAAGKAASEAVQGVRAYHGSPHDFDRFDMSKIGTGEGAQAYGHGLYFAENERVAKGYRDALGPAYAPLPDELMRMPEDIRGTIVRYADRSPDQASNAKWAQNFEPRLRNTPTSEIAALMEKTADARKGRMYEVKINADPEHFLDWDKPLSQQSEKIKEAMKNVGLSDKQAVGTSVGSARSGQVASDGVQGGIAGDGLKGSDLYDAIARKQVNGDWGSPGEFARTQATRALRDNGIPGIRYLDQGSRGAGDGSRNYVVFDDALVEILRKYGLLPPAALGGAAASQGQEQQPQALQQ